MAKLTSTTQSLVNQILKEELIKFYKKRMLKEAPEPVPAEEPPPPVGAPEPNVANAAEVPPDPNAPPTEGGEEPLDPNMADMTPPMGGGAAMPMGGGGGGGDSGMDPADLSMDPMTDDAVDEPEEEKDEPDEKPQDPIQIMLDDAKELAAQTKDTNLIFKAMKVEMQEFFQDPDHALGAVKALYDSNDPVLRSVAQKLYLFIKTEEMV